MNKLKTWSVTFGIGILIASSSNACGLAAVNQASQQEIGFTEQTCSRVVLNCVAGRVHEMYPYDLVAVYEDGAERHARYASGLQGLQAGDNDVMVCFEPRPARIKHIYSMM
jgi:hypothetical protein